VFLRWKRFILRLSSANDSVEKRICQWLGESWMSQLLYERSISHRGYLVIPFIFTKIDGETIYSYQLLSAIGRNGKFHKAENPTGLCDRTVDGITAIGKEFLDKHSDLQSDSGYFKHRYTYRHHLIITIHESNQWFYDHYPPDELRNIAAPKLFSSEDECLTWVKQGLDHKTKS